MTPTELSNDDVSSIFEGFPYIDRMVTAFAVILRVLLFRGDLGGIVLGRR